MIVTRRFMQLIADLQLHSKYSRAVSQRMDLFEIARWAAKKGICLVATGDWTHPMWFREIKMHLRETSPGIFVLKDQPDDIRGEVRFLLSTEISSIYSQDGVGRRIHNLIFSPSLASCEKLIHTLVKKGANLSSDGRPIVGISSKELLEMCLSIDPAMLFIPAHAWTPWFSLFGSRSGFDSIKSCFGDLESHIYAIETGLSSDPIMNWQIEELDHRSILSFSDAHSGPKLGREATVFVQNQSPLTIKDISYEDIASAIKQTHSGRLKIGYTIEFFPEEGKYHFSGHRNCGVKKTPEQISKDGTTCPVCRQPLTIGVEDRVRTLSSRILTKDDLLFVQNKIGITFVYDKQKKRRPFVSLVSLLEILLELHKGSKTTSERMYEKLILEFGTEFDILLKKSYDEIAAHGSNELAHAIEKVRNRQVDVDPGYDGVFGKVKIDEIKQTQTINEETQPSLF